MGCQSRQTALTMIRKLAASAERHGQRPDGCERLDQLSEGVRLRDREPHQPTKDHAALCARTPN